MNCTYCSNKAVANFQKVWIVWDVNESGAYGDEPKIEFDREEPVGEENVHVCEKHREEFRSGSLNN